MSNLKTWKVIYEIRYPAASLLFDNRGKIASNWQWQFDLSEWKIGNNQVTIHNKKNTKILEAGFKNTTITIDDPGSLPEYQKLATDFLSNTLELLQVKKIERIGMRYILAARYQQFKPLLNKMKNSLFSLNNDDWGVFGDEIDDIGFPLTLSFADGLKANFRMGPMKNDQLQSYFDSEDIKKRVPQVAIFIDFDLFKSSPNFNSEKYNQEIKDFIAKGNDKIIEISGNIIQRFGGFK